MKFAQQIERIQYLDEMIKKRSTGRPEVMAERLGISRSQLYNLIGYFNDIGMEIKYSKTYNSFYYVNNNKSLEINFSIKIITDRQSYQIYGGELVLPREHILTSTTFKSYGKTNSEVLSKND